MSKTQLWEAIQRQNDALENPDHRISMSGASFAKFYNLVWEVAHAEGEKEGGSSSAIFDKATSTLNKLENLIHGKRK